MDKMVIAKSSNPDQFSYYKELGFMPCRLISTERSAWSVILHRPSCRKKPREFAAADFYNCTDALVEKDTKLQPRIRSAGRLPLLALQLINLNIC